MVEIAQILNNSKVKESALTAILKIFHFSTELERITPSVNLSTPSGLLICLRNSFAEAHFAFSHWLVSDAYSFPRIQTCVTLQQTALYESFQSKSYLSLSKSQMLQFCLKIYYQESPDRSSAKLIINYTYMIKLLHQYKKMLHETTAAANTTNDAIC